jgi:hypothetical protein
MIHCCRSRVVVALVVLGILILPSAGCGLFPSSKTEPPREVPQLPPPPLPTATPAPPPPPSRPAGARIADEESLKFLIQGKTTRAEVRERFGLPQEVVLGPESETFIYYRDQSPGWFSRASERVEMLTVKFDTKGILKEFEYRYSGK